MFLDHYLNVIRFALYLLPGLVVVLLLPYLLAGRGKKRRAPGKRFAALSLFAYYLLTAYLLTVLPLPEATDPVAFCDRYAELNRPEWLPLEFLWHIYSTLKAFSLSALVHNFEFQATFFNFLLLLPFGFFLNYLFHQPPGRALAWSLGLSLFFEGTQLSGLYGVYPCPYRLFQVDDLLVNTAGAMYGYLLAGYLRFLPALSYRAPLPPAGGPALRRLMAFSLDWGILALMVRLTLFSIPLRTPGRLWGEWGWTLACFVLVPAVMQGQTLGKRLFRLRVLGPSGGPVGLPRLFLRYALLLLLPIAMNWAFNLWSSKGPDRFFYRDLQLAVNALWLVAFPLLILLRRDGRGGHDLLAGTTCATSSSAFPAGEKGRRRD